MGPGPGHYLEYQHHNIREETTTVCKLTGPRLLNYNLQTTNLQLFSLYSRGVIATYLITDPSREALLSNKLPIEIEGFFMPACNHKTFKTIF